MSSLRFLATVLLLPLVQISLFAQENGAGDELLPVEPIPRPVEMIQPVPAPEIPIGDMAADQTLPENLKIENGGGTIAGNLEDGISLGGR